MNETVDADVLIRVRELESQLERLRLSEARYRAVFEQAPDAMVVVDNQGKIVQVNRQLQQQLGFEPTELVGKPVEVLVPQRVRKNHEVQRGAYLQEPRTRPMGAGLELYAVRKDGTELAVEISLSPLVTEEGLFVLSALRDATVRRQFQRQLQSLNESLERRVAERTAAAEQRAVELERSNAELQQFAYVASHDLQEPLRMVSSYVQLLARRYAGRLDKDADEFIGFAVEGATRMQQLINDLLAFSRVGTRGGAFEQVDSNQAFEAALTNLRAAINDAHATVTADVLPTVQANGPQLVQLLQNLIGNGLKFRKAEEAPRVHVSANRREGEWIFSVADNGIGIAPEYYERIFIIFQRLHGRTDYPGTGIGLAVCRKIVERHGGRIWVEGEAGSGATFKFTLPDRERSRLQ